MATSGVCCSGTGVGDGGDSDHALHAWAGDLPGAPPPPAATGGGGPRPPAPAPPPTQWTGVVLIDCTAAAMDVWLTNGIATYHREGGVGGLVTTLPLAGVGGGAGGGACLPLAGALMGALDQPGKAYVVVDGEVGEGSGAAAAAAVAAAASGTALGNVDGAAARPVTLTWALPPDGGGVTAAWRLGRGTPDGGAAMAVALATRTRAVRAAALRAAAAAVAADTAATTTAGAAGAGAELALVTAVVAPASAAINAIKRRAAAVEAAAVGGDAGHDAVEVGMETGSEGRGALRGK
ncbi:hypothetical protein I4F81_007852 [Pyropia yezoensis]|uniref:Uncharacterized protein n=1 Tax=Pyropia yezoensis TaxID=2788 RepID=A0ACC3C5B7_PYRYE|nr:hypothetical protein I4F81_007852 [Neopyropia yezoensis]